MQTFKETLRNQSGIGMIEVLVTLVILLVGLLGLAGLMTQAQRSEMESYQRVQALVLLQDMAGRINANRKVTAYQNVSVGTSAIVTCPGATVAAQDICQWHNAITGAAETSGANRVGAMIGARGCVSYDSTTASINNTGNSVTSTLDGATVTTANGAAVPNTGTYTVSVAWQGLGDTAAPPASLSCGSGQYGNEAMRRVVSMPVKFGCITC